MSSSSSGDQKVVLGAIPAPALLLIPSSFEPLPDEIHEIARTLLAAAAELERCDPGLATHLTWVAFESALIWAMRLDGMNMRGVEAGRKHQLRKDWSIFRLGLPAQEVDDLYQLSKRRRYRFESSSRGGKAVRFSQAERAIEQVAEWILGIARFTQELSPGQFQTLQERLTLRQVTSVRLSLADVEEVATSGIYNSPLASAFHAMLRHYSRPQSHDELKMAASLAYYAAHQTVNQGICDGSNNSFQWTQLARSWGRRFNDQERLVHLDRLDSIGYEQLGDAPAAMQAFERARVRGDRLPQLHSTLVNREARVLAGVGEYPRAEASATAALSAVDKPGDASVIARRHLTLGYVVGLKGDYASAVAHFEHGLEHHQTHQMITKCNGAMYIMEACRRMGQVDKAVCYANIARSIAERYGYQYNLRRIERFDSWLQEASG